VLVCYRSLDLDPISDPSRKTVMWRSQALNRPEQELIGVQYTGGLYPNAAFVPIHTGSSWVYQGSGFKDGDTVPASGVQGPDASGAILGYEVDKYESEYPPPPYASYTLLSQSPYTPNNTQPDSSSGAGPQTDVSNASIYQMAPGSRAWVFATGTMSWSWALARPNDVDERIQRVTSNIMDRFVAGGILTSGGVSRSPAKRGDSVTLTATVRNTRSARTTVRVEVAVIATDGTAFANEVFDNVRLEPNETRTFSTRWVIPASAAPGPATLVVAARSPTGASLAPPMYWLKNGDSFFILS
jgi:hypothetical protein